MAFHSSGCHINLVRSDGRYPVSFFLSGCLEPLFHHQVPFPCILVLLLSVSFILMHILRRHNHWDIVSHDVLRLCIVSAFCMSYLVCDAFQDVWCILSYFGDAQSPVTARLHDICHIAWSVTNGDRSWDSAIPQWLHYFPPFFLCSIPILLVLNNFTKSDFLFFG